MFDTFTTVLRHKIWFDLWGAKQRTLQAVLTIAVGAFAIGAIFGGWQGILENINGGYAASNPSTINLRVGPNVSNDLLDALGRIDGVASVEGQMEANIQWRPTPSAVWQPATLIARDDYANMKLNLLRLEQGTWPTSDLFAAERKFDVVVDDQIDLRIDNNGDTNDYHVPISGIVYNRAATPRFVAGNIIFYTTHKHFAELLGADGFQKVTATIPNYNPEQAIAVVRQFERQLDDKHFSVAPGGFNDADKIAAPSKSPIGDTTSGIGLILQSIGVVAVILGLLLIYNTITAIVTQQTAQIGELKAVGASAGQLLVVYFTVVFAYGLLAALLAVPIGILAANGLRSQLVSTLGSDVGPFTVAIGPVLAQIALCLLAPLVIAAIPIIQGSRITVREAMSSYGLSSNGSKLDETLGRVNWLSRSMSLAISNTFRNRQRVILTQLSLAGAGITFIAVMSARTSLIYTINDLYNLSYQSQIEFTALRSERDQRFAQVQQVPGVAQVEVWQQLNGFIRLAKQTQAVLDKYPQVVGVPVPSQTYAPLMLDGRWLQPADTYAVVLQDKLAKDLQARVGDWVTLSLPDQATTERWRSEKNWLVVGIMLHPPPAADLIMVPRATLEREIAETGKGNRVQIRANLTKRDDITAIAQTLRSFYSYHGVDLAASTVDTLTQRSDKFITNITTVSTLLILMAVLVAAVGGIALSGVLSIGVLERRREIGVLRAIGATPRTILSQFITEGLMMGWLSWLIALALSYPAGVGLVNLLGTALQLGFVFQYSWLGVVLWLLLATTIGIFASWSPAQGAIKVSVQESLSYE